MIKNSATRFSLELIYPPETVLNTRSVCVRLTAELHVSQVLYIKRTVYNWCDLLWTAQLHVAACNGYLVVAEFLFRQLVNVDAADNDFWTPAHHAALWKQVCYKNSTTTTSRRYLYIYLYIYFYLYLYESLFIKYKQQQLK